MTVKSLARGLVPCFRCEGRECPKCGGTGIRERKRCAGCGEPAGSISAGTGRPVVGLRNNRNWSGPFYHVCCHPELNAADTWAMLQRVGES